MSALKNLPVEIRARLVVRSTDKAHLKRFVLDHLERFGEATRAKLDALLLPMLAAGLSDKQKRDRVKNLLSEMRMKDASIISEGFGPGAAWKLAKSARV